MSAIDRRHFVRDLLVVGALPGLSSLDMDVVRQVAQQAGVSAAIDPDPATFDFWNGFLKYKTVPVPQVPKPGERATRGAGVGLEREAFFFHYDRQGFVPAMDLPGSDLLADGDVNVSMNVVAFKPADADRDTFERLQSAQLRIDFIQDFPIVNLVDTMAWTAIALLEPDKTKKLPPLQNLNFDPSSASQKMQNITLPGGSGRWAVNLYAQKQDGFLTQMLRVFTKEIGRFAPVLGLPAVSLSALQSFNTMYGAFHSRPEHIFKSNPISVFATNSALKTGGASRGLPLRNGTYVLVPMAHAEQMTAARLDGLELKQGLIVPKSTPTVSVYSAAAQTLKDVTYATLDVKVKGAQLPCSGRG